MPRYCSNCGFPVPETPIPYGRRHPCYRLTDGQLEVMACLASGDSQPEIAARLHLTKAAVAMRARRVKNVTQSRTTAEAISKLVASGQLVIQEDGVKVRL